MWSIVNLILLFRRPEREVVLFSSLLPNGAELQFWQLLPFAGIHVYLWWSMWANMYFIAIPLYGYIFPMLTIQRQLRYFKDYTNSEGMCIITRKSNSAAIANKGQKIRNTVSIPRAHLPPCTGARKSFKRKPTTYTESSSLVRRLCLFSCPSEVFMPSRL